MTKKTQGFGVVEVIIIVVLLGVLGVGGWYVWQANSNTRTTTQTDNNNKSVPTQNATYKTYTNEDYGFRFEYPTSWSLNEDLKDVGRGAKEGEIKVTAPAGVVVYFKPNLGGKGGTCTPEPTDTPHHTKVCPTIEYTAVERLNTSTSQMKPVYLYHAKFTGGGDTKPIYVAFASSVAIDSPLPTTFMGAYAEFGIVDHRQRYIDNAITGFDHSTADSYDLADFKTAAQIMSSLTLY